MTPCPRSTFRRAFGRASAAATLCLAVPAAAGAQVEYPASEGYILRVEYREFRPKLEGELQKAFEGRLGTDVDVKDDLGLGDQRTFEIKGTIQVKRGHKIRGSYTPLEYDGTVEEVRRRFNYGAITFDRFDRALTTINGWVWSAEYEWDFVKGPRGFLGAIGGAKLLDTDVTLVNDTKKLRDVTTRRTVFPVLGVASRVYTGAVSVETEFAGLSARGDTFIEFETSVRFHISDRLAIQGGYRRLKAKLEDGKDTAEIKIKGWQFGLELSL